MNNSEQPNASSEEVGSQQPVQSSQVAACNQSMASSHMYNSHGIRHLTVNGDT